MRPDSDVDLLIEFQYPIGFRFNQLVEYIEGVLGMKVDILTRDGIRNIRVKAVAENIERNLIYV
jgi:predicted nucleotidyltransferase